MLTNDLHRSRYVLEVDRRTWIDASKQKYDAAYILAKFADVVDIVDHCVTPLNYARYINTLTSSDPAQAEMLSHSRVYEYNVDFEVSESTGEVWVVANRNIRVGEEIVADYSSNYAAFWS